MKPPSPNDDSRFFEFGSVILEVCDYRSRKSAIRMTLPCILFQAISPHLLGSGTVDDLKIKDPVAFWVPKLTKDRFVGAAATVPDIDLRTNMAIREEVEKIGKVFCHLQNYLSDPSDIIPILPLGTYISFIYRCDVDKILGLLEGIEGIKMVGVPEVQAAMASVLHQVLLDFNQYETKRPILVQ